MSCILTSIQFLCFSKIEFVTVVFILSDVVMIVGDLVDGYVSDLKEAIEPIKHIKATYGKYFVTGKTMFFS